MGGEPPTLQLQAVEQARCTLSGTSFNEGKDDAEIARKRRRMLKKILRKWTVQQIRAWTVMFPGRSPDLLEEIIIADFSDMVRVHGA